MYMAGRNAVDEVETMRLTRILALFTVCALALAGLCTALPAGVARAQGPQDIPYRIEVDISSQIVTIYMNGTDEIVRQMLCSTGLNDWTPTGDFILPESRGSTDRQPWYLIGDLWVKYATRIWGKVLFHSIPYDKKSMQAINPECLRKFGYPASHGCVRLRWQDAQFICENCLPGTPVKILKSGERKESLRELLFQETYDAGKGFSYESFLGISSEPGALSRVSEGQEVLNLQYRLRDLGIYNGEMTGTYDSTTVNAVRVAQYLLGDELNGVATADFQEKIYAPDAPTATNVELTEGMGGPAVHKLQENLATLCLYDAEALDSVYDVGVTEAVQAFQRAYCYPADGVATSEVQRAIDYEAGNVRDTFGGDEYACEKTTDRLNMVQVGAEAGVALREKPSQESKKLKSLRKGALAIVLEPGKSWSRVRSGSEVGYVKNDYVRAFEQELDLLRYTSQVDDRVYTVGSAASDYYAGASLPSEIFGEYLAANDQYLDISSLVNYVTVNTNGEAPSLNLREGPSADSAVLATVQDGTSLKVQRQFTEWTQVVCEGQVGYLMNRYLKFWTGPDDALEAEEGDEKLEASMVAYAVVESVVEQGAGVYDDNSDEAMLLGHLPDGLQLQVLDISGGWCLIQYKGHQGYMSVEDLQLVLKDAPEVPGATAPPDVPEGPVNLDAPET